MASSDDEEELVPQSVTNYYFVDGEGAPISFTVLPILFDNVEKSDGSGIEVFLHGTTDGGLQKVFKQVISWKLEFRDDQPNVKVFSKDKRWISLLKPRKSYEETIRTEMITLEMLNFLKRRPESSEKSLLEHLRKAFNTFEVRPSEDDFRGHLTLIKLFTDNDETLAQCQVLQGLLKEVHRERSREDVQNDPDVISFIVDDDVVDGDESDGDADLFDSVCAICDNGGDLLCCEGRCMRSFHATKKDGEDSDCKSLGYTRAQVEAIQNFLCKNCQYKRHQCFACGKLGSSDKSAGAEVFPCVSATCGHFYHPKCAAELLFPSNAAEALECEKKIATGESFTCPIHKCIVCKQGENKNVEELQFAMCRRCPKSYHRKCLPRKIAFEDIEEEGIQQRAWEDLLPNRILIYCLKHTIDEDLGTPVRNHIIFPEVPEKKKDIDVQNRKVKALVKRKREDFEESPQAVKPVKVKEKLHRIDQSHSSAKSSRITIEPPIEPRKKLKPSKNSLLSDFKKVEGNAIEEKKLPLKGKAKVPALSVNEDNYVSLKEKAKVSVTTVSPKTVGKILKTSSPPIDVEHEKRAITLMEKISSSTTLGEITRKRIIPSTYSYFSRHVEKSITHGKVEGSVEAIQTALQKLEGGGNVEDAKAVCEPEILKQLLKWGNKLKVYLAPALHGNRYTSFGRHFTKVDKLKEIVDKLQWYVQKGDTIVDFCCGANDFSRLMKEKLDAAGKKCNFKNFDVIQPKNDFCFEKRDWMRVQPKELPTGSQLIMGLNPPFGVKAALANKFIDKALTFKPKLLILIVPPETERLNRKNPPYDLIWEDDESLSGKSFYLPGSVDVNDKQMEQWNLKPPLLYLWSRQDWTTKHKGIAVMQGHLSPKQKEPCSVEEANQVERQAEVLPAETHVEERYDKRDATAEEREIRRGDDKSSVSNKTKNLESQKSKSRKRKRRKKKVESSQGRKLDELSDMSISPGREIGNHSKADVPSEPVVTSSERADHHSAFSGSGVELPPMSGGAQSVAVLDDNHNQNARRYTPDREDMFSSRSHERLNNGISSYDYGIRHSEERFPSYRRDGSVDPLLRKYANGYDGYLRSDPDMRMQHRLHDMQGQDDLSLRYRFSLGSDSALRQNGNFSLPSYGLSTLNAGTSAMQRYASRLDEREPSNAGTSVMHRYAPRLDERDPSNAGTSAMQRYAPRLDETNYVRSGHLGTAGSLQQGSSMLGFPEIRRDMPPNSLGLPPSPYPPYPRPGNGGWIDD